MAAEQQKQIESRLRRFSSARTGLANAILGLRLARVGLAALVVSLLLLAGWIANPFVNLGIAAVVIGLLLVQLVRFLRQRETFRSSMREAFHLEALAGDLNSRVVSALDFLDQGIDSSLTNAVVRHAVKDLEAPHEDKLDRAPRNRFAKHAAGWLVLLLVLGVTPWVGFANAAGTLSTSWRDAMARLFPVHATVTPAPGVHIHRVGESVELSLQLSKPAYDQVTLVELMGEDEEPVESTLAMDASGRAATTIVGESPSTRSFAFRFGDRQTEPVTLTFAELPSLVNMQTELIYPSYTRMLPRTLEGVQTRILGLEGTRMSLGFTFSKELESATISWADGTDLPLEVLGRYASISLIHNRPRQGTLTVTDIHGFDLEYPVVISFEIQTDERPDVALPRHLKDDMPMLPELAAAFGFSVRAADDYGVSRCVLSWQKVSVDNPTVVKESGEVERLISPPRRKVTVNFDGIFASIPLVPGDKIVFKVDAYDNRTPDAQKASTPRRSFFIYQQDLEELSIKQLGFGSMSMATERINKAKRATSVKTPEGIRSSEKVRNEFDGVVDSKTRAPDVRGEYSGATKDYLQILSGVKASGGGSADTGTASPPGGAPPAIPGAEPETEQ